MSDSQDDTLNESSNDSPNDRVSLEITSDFLDEIATEDERPCKALRIAYGTTNVINYFSPRTVSTLIGYVIGTRRPPRGAVHLLDQDVGALSKGKRLALRRRIGIAGGEAALASELTVAENIALPCQLRRLNSRQSLVRVKRISDSLEISDLLDMRASRLGVVERRIALLARALAHDPELILMEAPLAGLNTRWRDILMAQFKRLAVTGATLIVFHDTGGELSSDLDMEAHL